MEEEQKITNEQISQLLDELNSNLTPIEIERGNKTNYYIPVNERVKAFRKIFPRGVIKTEIIENTDKRIIMRCDIYEEDMLGFLANGYASETYNSTFINKASAIENCETSAVGRALGFLGIGISNSIASAEEVKNAIDNEEPMLTKTQFEELNANKDKLIDEFKALGIKSAKDLRNLTLEQADELLRKLDD